MTKHKKTAKSKSKSNVQESKANKKKSKDELASSNKSLNALQNIEEAEITDESENKSTLDVEININVEESYSAQNTEPVEKYKPSCGSITQPLTSTIIESYEGERGENGEFSGYGVAKFVGGNIYEGNFLNGVMNNRGKYIWTNGMIYEGDFNCNKISGYGRYEWPDGSFYEGEVEDGVRHGMGVFKSTAMNISYSGEWYLGKRHGKGITYYSENSWYEGDWVNNTRQGWGIRRYESGNVYEGLWVDGKRHGEGNMRWLTSNESYTGLWKDGVQDGFGTHTWYLHRVAGSQYPLRNEYVGDFCQSLRHGKGKFFFASGAVYSGEWLDNKKHGWGKFIFKNGRVFEGQFENDHMVEHPEFITDGSESLDAANIQSRSPICTNESSSQGILNMNVFGPGVSLDLSCILKDFKIEQHIDVMQQLSHLLLRNVSVLRRIYCFYSALGHHNSPDNTFVMTRLQFWRFLKDCKIHQDDYSLSKIDCILTCGSGENIHDPSEKILLREFLNSLVVLSYIIFKEKYVDGNDVSILSKCFRKLLDEHILENSCKVGGYFLYDPQHAATAFTYIDKCLQIYHASCKPRTKAPFDSIMTLREFLFLLKDFGLLGSQLSTSTVFEVLSSDNPSVITEGCFNIGMEITYIEFFEALVGCALHFEEKELIAPQTAEDNVSGNSDSMLSAQVNGIEQETLSNLHFAHVGDSESNFDVSLALSAPRGGTGEFLQTLSQMTLHDEIGNVVEEASITNEVEKDVNSEPISKEQQELDKWARKLSVFFDDYFFPQWEHLEMVKSKLHEFQSEKQELENSLQKKMFYSSENSLNSENKTPRESNSLLLPVEVASNNNNSEEQNHESNQVVDQKPDTNLLPTVSKKLKNSSGKKKKK